jgi:hypothetical protein
MACCSKQNKPKIVDPIKVVRPTVSHLSSENSQRLSIEYCELCQSILMLIVISSKERKQCTNPDCRKVYR